MEKASENKFDFVNVAKKMNQDYKEVRLSRYKEVIRGWMEGATELLLFAKESDVDHAVLRRLKKNLEDADMHLALLHLSSAKD